MGGGGAGGEVNRLAGLESESHQEIKVSESPAGHEAGTRSRRRQTSHPLFRFSPFRLYARLDFGLSGAAGSLRVRLAARI